MFWLHLGLTVVGGGLVAATLFPYSPMTLKLYMPKRETMIGLHRHRAWLRVVGVSLLAAVVVLALVDEAAAGWGWAGAGLLVFFGLFFATGYVPVIMRPPPVHRLLSADEADGVVSGDTDVVGVLAGDEARAYPRAQLARPHVFVDEIAGMNVAVTYCILCNTAMAFRAELDDRPLRFRAVTAFNNNIIYHDAERGDYIQQLDETIIAGPDAGRRLEPVPTAISSWKAWKSIHPESVFVELPPTGPRDKMMSRMLDWMIPLPGLAARRKPWHPVRGGPEPAPGQMTMVVGVSIGDEERAYPMATLKERHVVNDSLGGEPIVVIHDEGLDTTGVFSRRCDGRVLEFTRGEEPAAVIDDDGNRWDITGSQVLADGHPSGRQLTPVPHFDKLFSFSWSLFRPETTIYART